MCAGDPPETQSRRIVHQNTKNLLQYASEDQSLIMTSCSSSSVRREVHQRPGAGAPAGLAIVEALETELVQSGVATAWAKGAVCAPRSTTTSLLVPISKLSDPAQDNGAYCSDQHHRNRANDRTARKHSTRRAQKSIFTNSVLASPPGCSASTFNTAHTMRERHADFLSACVSCNRPLPPGKDIFMYRGDQAFCSIECRNLAIVGDERLPCMNQSNHHCIQVSSPSKLQAKLAHHVDVAILV